MRSKPLTEQEADSVARRFHNAYEAWAPSFEYTTRDESAKPWDQVPENNKALMRRVVSELFVVNLDGLHITLKDEL